MLLSKDFLFGLSAYVRQAELSLHRTPRHDLGALIAFYSDNPIAWPEQVLEQLNRHLPGGDSAVKGPLGALTGLLSGRLAIVATNRILQLKQELDEYGRLLRQESLASDEQRGRLRLRLTDSDLYLCRKLSARREREIAKVDHLNSAEFLPHKSLHEIVGGHWPLIAAAARQSD